MTSTRFGKGYSRVWQVVCFTLSSHLISMREKGFGAWCIQSVPFAVHSAHFVQKFFHALSFILEGKFFLPRANTEEGEFLQLQQRMRQRGIQCNMDHLQPIQSIKSILFWLFRLFWRLMLRKGHSPKYISGWDRGFGAQAIQFAPFAIHSAHFVLKLFQIQGGSAHHIAEIDWVDYDLNCCMMMSTLGLFWKT